MEYEHGLATPQQKGFCLDDAGEFVDHANLQATFPAIGTAADSASYDPTEPGNLRAWSSLGDLVSHLMNQSLKFELTIVCLQPALPTHSIELLPHLIPSLIDVNDLALRKPVRKLAAGVLCSAQN